MSEETQRILNRGGWGNGDVYLTRIDGRPVVRKTYAGKPAPIRFLGRYLISRERRAYEKLTGVAGVPGILEPDDPWSLLIEWVPGEKIGNPVLKEHGSAVIANLSALLARIHQRGVYHLDLRNQGNILIDPEQRVYLVDFASAIIIGDGPLGRVLAALLRRIDHAALAKWAARAG